MSDSQTQQLSRGGMARREAMLEELVESMARTHRRRRTRRRVLVAAGSACIVLVLLRLAFLSGGPSGDGRELANSADDKSAPIVDVPRQTQRGCVATVVMTDPTVLDRCRANPTGAVARIDDTKLLATLASINRPAGLIRFGDRVALSVPVTDAELTVEQ